MDSHIEIPEEPLKKFRLFSRKLAMDSWKSTGLSDVEENLLTVTNTKINRLREYYQDHREIPETWIEADITFEDTCLLIRNEGEKITLATSPSPKIFIKAIESFLKGEDIELEVEGSENSAAAARALRKSRESDTPQPGTDKQKGFQRKDGKPPVIRRNS